MIGPGRMKLRTKLLLVLLPALLIFSTVILRGTESYLQTRMKNTIDEQMAVNYEKIGNSIELLVQGVNMLSIRLLTDQKIYNLLNSKERNKEDKQAALNGLLAETIIDWKVVGKLYIETEDGAIYEYPASSSIGELERSFLERVRSSPTPVWGGIRKDEQGAAYLQLGRKFQNFYTGQQLGVLVVDIRETALYELIRNTIHPWGYSVLVDGDRIISAGDKSKLGGVLYDWTPEGAAWASFDDNGKRMRKIQLDGGPSYAVSAYQLSGAMEQIGVHWAIVNVASEDKMYAGIHRMKNFSSWIQGFLLVAVLLLSFYLSAMTLKPLRGLLGKIRRLGKAGADESNRIESPQGFEHQGDELQVLAHSFDNMVVRINELIAHNNESKDKQRESELIALQAQINPHFLYNTLDAIGWIAKINRQTEIERLVLELASFYRLSLHKGDKYIQVGEELGIVKSYVAIENIRYPDKFDVVYEVDEQILALPMLKIILQPLLENAIIHGIGPKSGRGRIVVRGQHQPGALQFEITDDGIGFDSDKLSYAIPKTYSGRGYGIANVDERIRMEYGPQFGIVIRSVQGQGTTATVLIGLKDERT
ncbi:sensor histidine kinase [Paenibacillus sp. GCM10027626]|uniref:sensor histidine kinase n=1 Tax=Paenibacillus sp. GCM10027626 TaxID=3273411 RepID=UPI0036269354